MTVGWRAGWNSPPPAGPGATASGVWGRPTPAMIARLKAGMVMDGIRLGPIEATIDRRRGGRAPGRQHLAHRGPARGAQSRDTPSHGGAGPAREPPAADGLRPLPARRPAEGSLAGGAPAHVEGPARGALEGAHRCASSAGAIGAGACWRRRDGRCGRRPTACAGACSTSSVTAWPGPDSRAPRSSISSAAPAPWPWRRCRGARPSLPWWTTMRRRWPPAAPTSPAWARSGAPGSCGPTPRRRRGPPARSISPFSTRPTAWRSRPRRWAG